MLFHPQIFQELRMIQYGSSSSLCALALVFACVLLSILPGQALAAGTDSSFTVERTLQSSVAPGSELEVQLNISGFETGGIVETLPEGFIYLNSSLPETQVRAKGQHVIFALLEEDKVSYRVKTPASGDGIFSGEWEEVIEQKKGKVQGNSGVVVSSSAFSESGNSTGKARDTVSDPGNASGANQKPCRLPFAGPGLLGGTIGFAAGFRALEKSLKEKKGGIL
jgi:hypothetical protein